MTHHDSKSDSSFTPCCQKGDGVCGKEKHISNHDGPQPIKTAPNVVKKGKSWLYTEIVRDHFFNPRNLLKPEDEASYKADGVGEVGSPACGDVMKVWIQVKPIKNSQGEIDMDKSLIADLKWQTFGCGSAISSTSIMSEMVTEDGGMSLNQAMDLKAMDINKRLGGLPTVKIHCSILGDEALKAAIAEYLGK
jgi:NifU-like protein involved in Fe-S cluster formation